MNKQLERRVNHPLHYQLEKPIFIKEAMDVIEAFHLDFCLGNAVKYILRAGKKSNTNTKVDLEKAVWYIKRFIEKNCDEG